ncbi:MAG: serine/threonine protein kinase [Cellvibrionaceae bacterium]|nr:serine/threonine protein kinase [Cellvibrionaceae bacterium]
MTVEIPGYRTVRVLGKGGMATVYLAVQQIFERQVALKVMSTSLAEDPSFGQRFLREARIVSQLVHPNIITVYDVGVHNNAYYLSMEYIDGPDLKQARDQLTLTQKIQIILDIAKALDFAGRKGYVHRDIKPENILLRRDSYSAVLMDFGIARAAEADLSVTQTGMALGTPHYMSPEQAKGQLVDNRSDLYSLGVVLYYLLTGSVPYHADSAVAIGIKHLTEPVPSLPPHLQTLQSFIDRLMAKRPEDRYQGAAELISALQGVDTAALERRERTHRQELAARPAAADSMALTQLHDAPAAGSVTGATTTGTHITRFDQVKNIFWQYKLLAVGALVVVCAAVVIVKRPFHPGAGKPAVESVQAPASRSAPVKQAPEEEEWALDAPDAPVYSAGPVSEITLADLTGREYRRVQEQSNAQTRPAELVQRLQRSLQKATGRAGPMREINLNEKVAELRARLQRDPRDLETQKSLAMLAAEYFKKANSFISEGDFASAQNALAKGRILFPEYRAQYEPLAARLKERDRLERLLAKADEQLAAGKLVSPWRNNALHYYRSALRLDGDLLAAQKGIRNVERALMDRARHHYASGQWGEAADAAEEVLKIRPGSEEAHQFLLKLEQNRRGEVASAPAEPERPRPVAPPAPARSVSLSEGTPIGSLVTEDGPQIQQLRVDGKLLSGMNARQLQAVQAQRTLFVSFEYKNFPGDKQRLSAELADGKGNRVAEVPVIVAQAHGLHRFRFERPREPFPAGHYRLVLSLDGAELMRAEFLVQ